MTDWKRITGWFFTVSFLVLGFLSHALCCDGEVPCSTVEMTDSVYCDFTFLHLGFGVVGLAIMIWYEESIKKKVGR